MMMPLDLHLMDLSVHSTCHEEQEEFDAILAIIGEEEGLDIPSVLALLEKRRVPVPRVVQDFCQARLTTFRRNVGLVQESVVVEMEDLAENLVDALDEEDMAVALKHFVQARVHTFYGNLKTISSLLTTSTSRKGKSSSGRAANHAT